MKRKIIVTEESITAARDVVARVEERRVEDDGRNALRQYRMERSLAASLDADSDPWNHGPWVDVGEAAA